MQRSRGQTFARWLRIYWRTVVAVIIALVAFVFTALLAFWASSSRPPSSAQSLLFVVIAGVLQAVSAIAFQRVGRGNPGVARRALERQLVLIKQVRVARARMETARESVKAADLRAAIGVASVDFAYIEEAIAGGAEDWVEFLPKEEELKVIDQ